MANRITVFGIEAELDRSGLWTSRDADLAHDLNRRCSTETLSGNSPDPVADLLECAVEKFSAVAVERDDPVEGVRGRVY